MAKVKTKIDAKKAEAKAKTNKNRCDLGELFVLPSRDELNPQKKEQNHKTGTNTNRLIYFELNDGCASARTKVARIKILKISNQRSRILAKLLSFAVASVRNRKLGKTTRTRFRFANKCKATGTAITTKPSRSE
jgi:hypothetical protein